MAYPRTSIYGTGRIVARDTSGPSDRTAFVVAGIHYGPGAGANDRVTDHLDSHLGRGPAGPPRPPIPGDASPESIER